MSTNISQLRRLVFRKYNKTLDDGKGGFETFTLEPDDLGQDTIMTVNIAPRMMSRASSVGTSETPIAGTLDAFAGSVTFIMDNFQILGKAIRRWIASTYEGATPANGQITDMNGSYCNGNDYLSVIAQGVCDDGSSVDVELTRCLPSVDDDIEIGGSDATEVTLNLHPIVYNATTHAGDGYPEYSYRFGDYSTTENMRLNATTGEYQPVTAPEVSES